MKLSKIQEAAKLLHAPPVEVVPNENITISLRLPGALKERVFALYDVGDEGPFETPDVTKPRVKPFSRNKLLVSLIEAGLEAVENLQSQPTLKGKK